MTTGDPVQIREHQSTGNWEWSNRSGHITAEDKYCYTVRTDDGETIRDVREHFRAKQ